MKLKCNKHNRRVTTGQHSFLHLTGDGSRCDSRMGTIGDVTVTFKGTFLKLPNVYSELDANGDTPGVPSCNNPGPDCVEHGGVCD